MHLRRDANELQEICDSAVVELIVESRQITTDRCWRANRQHPRFHAFFGSRNQVLVVGLLSDRRVVCFHQGRT